MEYMRHQGKIMIPWQKQEGLIGLSAFQPELLPVL